MTVVELPGRRVVLCHGTFDLLHLGHIRHLKEAKTLGDYLIVSLTTDHHVGKGQGRPVFTVEQRAEALRALDCVDDVVVSKGEDAVEIIRRVHPAVYVKGIDYADRQDTALVREISAVEEAGGKFHTTRSDKWSSSRIINGERLSKEALAYVESARNCGFLGRISAAFDRADQHKITFVGETIIDEYRYVTPLGKPVKEFCLATVEAREAEEFEGGVIAASKHAEWAKVSVVTGKQMMRKTRFVDSAFNRKLFEVYSEREIELNAVQRAALQIELSEATEISDILLALDFGHGLIGSEELDILQFKSKFLAVNAQTNTGNYGFNPVTKYLCANYVCVDEPEARLATGMQNDPIKDVIPALSKKIRCGKIAVTHGRYGSVAYDASDGFPKHIPAFVVNGIDTMGAGDAFLAVSAPLVAAGLGLEEAAFVGNVAGAIKVGIVGHRRHVGRKELMHNIKALLA